MPQDKDFIGTPVPKIDTGDKNQAVSKPSPANRDKNIAMPKPENQNWGIRKQDMSPIGPGIHDKGQ